MFDPRVKLCDNFDFEIRNLLTDIRNKYFGGETDTYNEKEQKEEETKSSFKIVSRKLCINFYNGRTFICDTKKIELKYDSNQKNCLIWDGTLNIRFKGNLNHDI